MPIRTALSADTTEPHWGPYYVTEEEYNAVLRAMVEPVEPTESIKRGAELLRKLYGSRS